MRVYGVDFTSAPKGRKPITIAACRLEGDVLRFDDLERIGSLDRFEAWLGRSGPWIAGLDFPFTQSRSFLRNMGWPVEWGAFVDHVGTFDKAGFRSALNAYKAPRPYGDKEHSRAFERGTGAASPQKLHGVPVALMQFEGAARLRRCRVHLPGLIDGDGARVAVEAYPGVAARDLIGGRPYKNDTRAKQTPAHFEARTTLLDALTGETGRRRFGLTVLAPQALADDPAGDELDALLCAVQAAWAHGLLAKGGLDGLDLSEGWIADPRVVDGMAAGAVAVA